MSLKLADIATELTIADLSANDYYVYMQSLDGLVDYKVLKSAVLPSNTTAGATDTTDATIKTIETIPVPTDSIMIITSKIFCVKTGGAGSGTTKHGSAFIITAKVKNISGTVTVDTIQADYTSSEALGSESVTMVQSGTNVLIRVTGIVSDNITWRSLTNVVK